MHYTLMHKTAPVLRLAIDEDTGVVLSIEELFAPEHLPVGIPCTNGVADRQALNSWWTGRAIPASRAGLRDALETLAVPSPQLLLTKCYGLSLSDQYWVCPENSGLRWENINFFDNEFSPDVGNILFGHAPAREAISLLSPDNTSDGWLRKRWKIVAGKRCLIKGGSNPFQQEPLGEALASAVMRRLEVAHVPYSVTWMDEKPYSVCEDFVTSQTDLVSAWHIMQTQKRENHVSKWQHYLHCCDALGIPGVRESLNQMLTVDFIIANEDRHFNNFGALRNAETLDWQGAAPIFDCGTSLWFDKTAAQITHRNAPSKPFRSDHAEQIKLVTSFDWLDMSALRGIDEEFHAILQGSAFIEPARAGALCIALRKRVELLGDVLRVQNRHKEDHAR
jgi:hypothetical protein